MQKIPFDAKERNDPLRIFAALPSLLMFAHKPTLVGISWGDPHGIGSECILKAFDDARLFETLLPVVYGHGETLRRQAAQFNVSIEIRDVDDASDAEPGALNCVNIIQHIIQPEWGQLDSQAGEFARLSLEAAVNDITASKLDVLVTAPINKDAIQSKQFKFPGHTEYLADKTEVRDVLMILASGTLRVGVVTGHIALRDVASSLSIDRIVRRAQLLHMSLKGDFGLAAPRIAVFGLNPHAGDNGLIGEEEETIILPAIRSLSEAGINVKGPFGADGLFGSGEYKSYDGILAMYHDQGLIPFKSLSFGLGVNFTAGLPIVRTSPDHGTAFDIAGKGMADGRSLRTACLMGANIRKHRAAAS